MSRGHTPFGYRIENGSAVVVPEEADQVRKVYSGYISGQTFINAAKSAGLTMTHSSVKRLLQNTHYLGDEFYPAIIDKETFDAAEEEHQHRLELMCRNYKTRTAKRALPVKTRFIMKPVMRQEKDPYEQAAYLYSLIESEE